MKKASELRKPLFQTGLITYHTSDLPLETQEWLKRLIPPSKVVNLETSGSQWARGGKVMQKGGERW